MEILSKLFGSGAKVKLMRLFLFNPENQFNNKNIREKTRLSPQEVRREISLLTRMGLIKKRSTKKNGPVWLINPAFPYLEHLKALMTYTLSTSRDDIARKIAKACKLKTLIFSGFFINNLESRADILIVAQSIKKDALKTAIKKIEAELGREIHYVIFNPADFGYRQSIGDRLVRDIFDYPHIIAYDKLGVAESV